MLPACGGERRACSVAVVAARPAHGGVRVAAKQGRLSMAGEWQERTLGDLTENFDSVRVPVKEADRLSGSYPYYGASGIVDHVDGFLFDGEYLLIAEDGENLRTRATPVAFMARGKFWVNNHAHIVRGNDKADTRFLMYSLAAADISGFLSGSTMPKLTQGNMNRIPLLTPPLPEQRAIAHILGTLDDKIELNRRMNETLEAMARTLFKSWFVDFDPVRAKMGGRWRRGSPLHSPLPAGEGSGVPIQLLPLIGTEETHVVTRRVLIGDDHALQVQYSGRDPKHA